MLFLLCILILVFTTRFHEGFYCPHTQTAIQAFHELNAKRNEFANAQQQQAALKKSTTNKADEIMAWNNQLEQALEVASDNLAAAYESKQTIEKEYSNTNQLLSTCDQMNRLKLKAINIFS